MTDVGSHRRSTRRGVTTARWCNTVNTEALRVASYRLRATLQRRWGGYLTVVLHSSAWSAAWPWVPSERPGAPSPPFPPPSPQPTPDLDVQIGTVGSYALNTYSPAELRAQLDEIAHLPNVEHVAAYINLLVTPLSRDATPALPPGLQDNAVATIGSVNGLYFDQDRVAVRTGPHGRPPARSIEFVATVQAARLLGWHLGEVVPIGMLPASASDVRRTSPRSGRSFRSRPG